MTRRPLQAIVILWVLAGVAAAQGVLTPSDLRLIQRWLDCHECIEHELDSVRAVAVRVPAPTVSLLRATLFNGLSVPRRDTIAQQLHAVYARNSAAALDFTADTEYVRHYNLGPPPASDSVWTAQSLAAFDRIYRIRSAVALGSINTPSSKAALDSAYHLALEPRVLRFVRYARDSIATP